MLQEQRSHGYDLLERLEEFGFEEINPGTMYRTLRQMEKEGLCESVWDTSASSGPARRVYLVTDAGEAHLVSWVEGCKKYQQAIDSFFRAYGGRPRYASEHTEAS
jgi:poly-beta-hydroxybutyrate-responsive repressor